jgi:RND family efflux transporter MFP subunit
MFLGRVVLPALGLLLAATLSWQAIRNVKARSVPENLPVAGTTGRHSSARGADRVIAEGRVVAYPGAEVTVGTEVLGTILSMPAHEKSVVHKGDLLAELRCDAVAAEFREAQFHLSETEAELRFEQARLRLDRLFPILRGKEVPASGTRQDMAAAIARRDAAKAALERLQAELAKYRILAPIDGVVVARQVDPGETVSPATPLVTIADLRRLRIEVEVDEFDIGRVTLGARATITAEGYPGRQWRGEVEEIADVVGPRQTRPEDPGRPTDTRILPVRAAFREPCPLKLGQRVEVEIASPARAR